MEFPEATKYPFMFYAPDLTDLKAPQRRSESRPEHLERILAFIEKGILKVAGPTLTPESVLPGVNQQKMDGSLFVMEACSIEEVKAFVEDDIYYRNNVWDKAKIIIIPMLLLAPK